MVHGPAAEVLALAALALATRRYATLGRELLDIGIAIIEGPDGGCSHRRLKGPVLRRRSVGSRRHRSWP
jgi:hypothetical protein